MRKRLFWRIYLMLLASLAIALLTGIVFGVLPASRASKLEPVAALARR